MAFEKNETKNSCVLLFLATLIIQVSLSNTTNYDCKGKAFYCPNSTHFMICVDLGDGVSTAVEDFVIPCPPPTICTESNVFECEYHTTILKTVQSEDIEPASEINLQTSREDIDFTTFIPFLYNKDDSVKSEKYYDNKDEEKTGLTTENEYITTQLTLQAESTTETEIIESPLYIETAVPLQERNSRYTSSFAGEEIESNTLDYKTATTTAEKVSQNTVAGVYDYITTSLTQPADILKVIAPEEYEYTTAYSYETNFDTVSTTTLSERATTEGIKTSQTIENVSKAIASGEYDYITTSNYESSIADTKSDQPAENVPKSIVSEEYSHTTTSYYENQFETVSTTTVTESSKPEEIKATQPVNNVTKASDDISTSVYEHHFDTVSTISKTTQSAGNVSKTIVPGDYDHITTPYYENHFEAVSIVEKTITTPPTNNTLKSIVSGDEDYISTSIYEHNFDTMGTTTPTGNSTTEETKYYATEIKSSINIDEFSIPSESIFNNQETSETLNFYTDQEEITTHIPFNIDATSQETYTSTSYRQLGDSLTTSHEKSEIIRSTSSQISDIASTTEGYTINESSIYPEVLNIPLEHLKYDYGLTDFIDTSMIDVEIVTSLNPTESFDISHTTKMDEDQGINYQNTGKDILNKVTADTTTNIYDLNTVASINSPQTNTIILEGLEKITSNTPVTVSTLITTSSYGVTDTVVQSEYTEAINTEEQHLLLSTDTGNNMPTDLEQKRTNLNVETNYQLSIKNSLSPSIATITLPETNNLENIIVTNVEYKIYDEEMPSEIEDHMELGNSKKEIQYNTNEGLNDYTTSTQSYESTTTSLLSSTDTLYTGINSSTNGYEPVTNQISYDTESIKTFTTPSKYLNTSTIKYTTIEQGLIAVYNLNSVENKTDKNFTTVLTSSPLLKHTATDEYNKILQNSTMSAEELSTSSTNGLNVLFEEITTRSNPRIEVSILPYKESDIVNQTELSIKENYTSSSVLDEINPRNNQLLDKITSTGTYTSVTVPLSMSKIDSLSLGPNINYIETSTYTYIDTVTTPENTTLLNDETSESSHKFSINIENLQHKIEKLPTYDSNTGDVNTKKIKNIIEINKLNTDRLEIPKQRVSHILNTETPTIKEVEKPDLTDLITKQTTYDDKYFTLSPKNNQSVEESPYMTQNIFFDGLSTSELHPTSNDTKKIYSNDSTLLADTKINHSRDLLTKSSNSEKNNNISGSLGSITKFKTENLKKVDVHDLQDTEINSKIPIVLNLSYDNKSKITTQTKTYIHQIPSNSTELVLNITAEPNERVNKTDLHMSKQFPEQKNLSTSNISHKNTVNETTEQNIRNVTLPSAMTKPLNFTCLNRYRGKYPDQSNCQAFYICIGRQQPLVGNCPQNSVFSNILNQCTRNLSHCIRNNQFKCVSSGRFSDLWARDTYYICMRGKENFVRFKMKCQKGYYLNRTTVTCVNDPVNVPLRLQSSLSKESLSTSSSSSSVDSKSVQIQANKKFECKKEGIFPDANHCRKYYICKQVSKSEIRLKKKKCDSDEVFNEKKKKCVDEDSYECKT